MPLVQLFPMQTASSYFNLYLRGLWAWPTVQRAGHWLAIDQVSPSGLTIRR